VWRVFVAFLGLGLTAFGGPIAHIGYFEAAFVRRRQWLSPRAFADLVALCHVLPGPASSQLGLGIGHARAGVPGALAAWAGFTLPSALILGLLGVGAGLLPEATVASASRGLAWAAAAVVGQAVLHMARARVHRPLDALPILAAAALAWGLSGLAGQFAALAFGAAWGLAHPDPLVGLPGDARPPPAKRAAIWLVAWGVLLVVLPLAASLSGNAWVALADRFYRTGSLVFGGGHVVLPLLKAEWVDQGLLSPETFLAGYGAAQAVPGPLFTIAAYLGAALHPEAPIVGGAVALLAIFLPSMLLVFGVLPFAERLRAAPRVGRALAGVNFAVIGLLAAAWVDPVLIGAVRGPWDGAAVFGGLVLLVFSRVPVLAVVAALTLFGLALSL
jgi:chromate transporter